MPFHNGWTLLFTRYLTIAVDTMHDDFAKTTKLLLMQNHNIQFTTTLLRTHRMPPVNADDYFYSFIGFLASPRCLHIAGEISAFYLPSVAHFRLKFIYFKTTGFEPVTLGLTI